MYRQIADFTRNWDYEQNMTLDCLKRLTDESLAHSNHAGTRSLARLSQHLAEALPAMMHHIGAKIDGPEPSKIPSRASDVVSDYERAANSLLAKVENWKDDDLLEMIPFFGRPVPRGAALMMIVLHQAHHRGQLTVLMREAGVIPPGVYGPTQEQWQAMGQPAHV